MGEKMPKKTPSPKSNRAVAVTVGSALRMAREVAGLSQTQASARIGIARTSVVKIEQGQHSPTIDTFLAFCAACRVDPATILRAATHHTERTRSTRKEGA
jgi:transcriptional regulator with XRE-family HTH domain